VHYPITLYLLPLIAFFTVRALLGPLLYWRRVRCSLRETVGAAIAGMGLSHAIGLGVFAGLAQRESVFEITGKGTARANAAAAGRALGGAREEALLLLGLAICALSVYLTRQVNHLESALWIVVLALQGFPYLAAVLCAGISMLPESTVAAPEPVRVPDARGTRAVAVAGPTVGAMAIAVAPNPRRLGPGRPARP
jgi:hypothetical protein